MKDIGTEVVYDIFKRFVIDILHKAVHLAVA